MNTLIIRGGRVIDPANKRDEIVDLFIRRRKNRHDDFQMTERNRKPKKSTQPV